MPNGREPLMDNKLKQRRELRDQGIMTATTRPQGLAKSTPVHVEIRWLHLGFALLQAIPRLGGGGRRSWSWKVELHPRSQVGDNHSTLLLQ